MNSIILLRGLPGSGKSTLATILKDDSTKIFSIDDYFIDENGTYNFDFKKNHLAYQNCIDNCKKAAINLAQKIIIHHTFTLEWEMEPYFALAKEYNYKLFVVTVENRQGFQNTHDISEEQIKKMAEKYKVVLF
jgi:predicted kinase